jgi:DNA polymerase
LVDSSAVGGNIESLDRATVESLLDWWRLSGVDVAVDDQPRAWLRSASPLPSPKTVPPAATASPENLAQFRDWLSSAHDLPMDRPGAVRIAPHGDESAPVMVIGDLPDRDDAAAGKPFGGEAAELMERMLKAIGLDSSTAYQASLSCFHAPGARLGRDELDRCGSIARDHVRLAKPERLILFGDAPARALIGEPLARARGRIHKVEGVRTIATFHPRWLLHRPSDKALAWKDLQLLMSEGE